MFGPVCWDIAQCVRGCAFENALGLCVRLLGLCVRARARGAAAPQTQGCVRAGNRAPVACPVRNVCSGKVVIGMAD